MAGINLQIRISEAMHKSILKLAPRKKSAFAREALAEKIRRETERRMDQQWIEALKRNPQDTEFDDDWHAVEAESWGEK